MKYHLAFEITVDGFTDWMRWRQRRAMAVSAAIALALIALNGLSLWLGTPLEFAVLFSIPAVLLLIATQTPYLDRWRIRRQARSLLGSIAKFDIGPDGIDAVMVGTTSRVPWSSLTEVQDNGRVVVVARDRLPVLWISAAAFPSEEERTAIVAFMRSQISAAQARSP